MGILTKIFSSKGFSISVVVLLVSLLLGVIVVKIQKASLAKKIEEMNKVIDTQNTTIVNLNKQIEERDVKIRSLQNGITVIQDYQAQQKEALENDISSKLQAMETINASEENKTWWNTPIPDDVVDLFICH